MKKLFLLNLFMLLLLSCAGTAKQKNDFIRVNENGGFVKNDRPYYYIGANLWYGAILGSQGEGGDRGRLLKELDALKAMGADNLRILVGADGADGITAKVEPALQTAPGVYNDDILDGLDFLLSEMAKRDMSAVLYLNNSWEWSGGYGQYLEWSGHGKAPIPAVDGWNAFSEYVARYAGCDECHSLFFEHVKYIIGRTNRYTGKRYVDDPAIMSWQIGNEPRAFSPDNKVAFALWINLAAKLIKSLDPNHLVSVGSEGYQGCEGDIRLWELIHSYDAVDYSTIHIWPYNWGWAPKENLAEKLDYSIEQSNQYIGQHLKISAGYRKPMVIEEFGFPRDGFRFDAGSEVTLRDSYYSSVFAMVADSSRDGGILAGCNFWAWGGYARQVEGHIFWKKGDDYTGDPAQEEQGLYSVFAGDSTAEVVSYYNRLAGNLK